MAQEIKSPAAESARDLSKTDLVLFEESSYLRSLLTQLVKTFQPRSLSVYADEDAAISRLAFSPIDCVIVDWRPEDGIGPQLMKFARRDTACPSPEMGIVCMATVASRPSVEQARDAGANVYLTKPFSAQELRRKIEAAIFAPRNFVVMPGYVGPDRRHRRASFDGDERRGKGPLSQGEIDTMMAE